MLFCKIVNMLTILNLYQNKGETFKLKRQRESMAHAIINQDASTSVLKAVICYGTF